MARPVWQVAGKRIIEEEADAQHWIEQCLGRRFLLKYEDELRDGIVLCELMNVLQPGIIRRVNTSGGDYKFMDNIQQFLRSAKNYGVPETDLFQAVDLIEKKNVNLVTMCVFALGRTTFKHPEWRGPTLGPKPADENQRNFSEEVLRSGETVIGLQASSFKGATQSGQNFGATRKILLGK